MPLDDGTLLRAFVHPEYFDEREGALQGKCLDLGSACKRCAIDPMEAHLAVLVTVGCGPIFCFGWEMARAYSDSAV